MTPKSVPFPLPPASLPLALSFLPYLFFFPFFLLVNPFLYTYSSRLFSPKCWRDSACPNIPIILPHVHRFRSQRKEQRDKTLPRLAKQFISTVGLLSLWVSDRCQRTARLCFFLFSRGVIRSHIELQLPFWEMQIYSKILLALERETRRLFCPSYFNHSVKSSRAIDFSACSKSPKPLLIKFYFFYTSYESIKRSLHSFCIYTYFYMCKFTKVCRVHYCKFYWRLCLLSWV